MPPSVSNNTEEDVRGSIHARGFSPQEKCRPIQRGNGTGRAGKGFEGISGLGERIRDLNRLIRIILQRKHFFLKHMQFFLTFSHFLIVRACFDTGADCPDGFLAQDIREGGHLECQCR